jgi:hypothetical protein
MPPSSYFARETPFILARWFLIKVDRMISWCCSFLLSTVIRGLLRRFLVCLSIVVPPPDAIHPTFCSTVSQSLNRPCPTVASRERCQAVCRLARLMLQVRRFTSLYDREGDFSCSVEVMGSLHFSMMRVTNATTFRASRSSTSHMTIFGLNIVDPFRTRVMLTPGF